MLKISKNVVFLRGKSPRLRRFVATLAPLRRKSTATNSVNVGERVNSCDASLGATRVNAIG